MIAASKNISGKLPPSVSSSRRATYFYVASVVIALAASAVLVALLANAQAAEPIPPDPQPVAPQSVAMAPSTVRYSAKDIERAFNFMDANQDGMISRQEAAGFRNVAKYFDAADTNKDNALSPEEFASALNRP